MKPKYFINVNQDEPVSIVVSLMQRRKDRESDSHFIGFQILKFDENQNKSQVCNQITKSDLINKLLKGNIFIKLHESQFIFIGNRKMWHEEL